MSDSRNRVRELAERSLAKKDRTAWFEEVYGTARRNTMHVPWADLAPNPNLVSWTRSRAGMRTLARLVDGRPAPKALVVGAGLGDDAEFLVGLGFDVVAFDVSPSAIAWSRERFPSSRVRYEVADLFDPPPSYGRAFRFVLEAYTLQSFPPTARVDAFDAVASFVAPAACLLVIALGRDERESIEGPPWPLAASELERFETTGLEAVRFEDYADSESPPRRRFRMELARPESQSN